MQMVALNPNMIIHNDPLLMNDLDRSVNRPLIRIYKINSFNKKVSSWKFLFYHD